jgi:protein-tyrosine-phosphatase
MAAPRRILPVCTANACGSRVAERILQPPPTMEAAGPIDVDFSHHRSRPLTAELIRNDGADLVGGMTREHPVAAHILTARDVADMSRPIAEHTPWP